MLLNGINHITLAVSDIEKSIKFYRDVLGMALRYHNANTVYFESGALWLCLSYDPECRKSAHPDYTHIAFDVNQNSFDEAAQRILNSGAIIWKDNKSEGQSLYFLDPDHHKLEIHVGNLESRLKAYQK